MTDSPTVDSITPLGTETDAAPADALQAAESFTVIIHGVGATSSEVMLSEAMEGYVACGLGDTFRELKLPQCPAISGQSGVSAMVLKGATGSHVIAALPWANRRIRLANIVLGFAWLLIWLTVVLAITFFLRHLLDQIINWLRPWSHRLLAITGLAVWSFILYLVDSDPKKEFRPPSLSIFMVPPLLIIGLDWFVSNTHWFWLFTLLLIGGLWVMASVIVMRCIPLAPSLRWRATLTAFIIAMGVPGASSIHLAWHLAGDGSPNSGYEPGSFAPIPIDFEGRYSEDEWDKHVQRFYSQPDSRNSHLLQNSAGDRSLSPRAEHGSDRTDAQNGDLQASTPHDSGINGHPAAKAEPKQAETLPNNTPNLNHYRDLVNSDDSSLTPLDLGRGAIKPSKPAMINIGTSRQEGPGLGSLINGREFIEALLFEVISLAACLWAFGFNWVLDLALDVLNFGGKEKLRTSLLVGTVDAIQWLHKQSPDASIIVVGHSLGSVIASHAINCIPPEHPIWNRLTLVTMGSPLNYVWRLFPNKIKRPDVLAAEMCGSARWINLWREADPIGKMLDIGATACNQYCVGKGGHTRYFADGFVWKVVAQEALSIGGAQATRYRGDRVMCVVENQLWPIVLVAIFGMLCAGWTLWALPF